MSLCGDFNPTIGPEGARCQRDAGHDGPHVCGKRQWLPRCESVEPGGTWKCTLEKGHAGLHYNGPSNRKWLGNGPLSQLWCRWQGGVLYIGRDDVSLQLFQADRRHLLDRLLESGAGNLEKPVTVGVTLEQVPMGTMVAQREPVQGLSEARALIERATAHLAEGSTPDSYNLTERLAIDLNEAALNAQLAQAALRAKTRVLEDRLGDVEG